MTGSLYTPEDEGFKTIHDEKYEFKNDILLGLLKQNKKIPSKYFYDERGCELFDQITRHQDYYITRCELEILSNYKKQLSSILSSETFNLIELGPGEGIKPRLLIEQFMHDSLEFTYTPIDISKKYLKKIVDQFNRQLPKLEVTAIKSDYFQGLDWLSKHSNKRNFILFLGSSLGNLDFESTTMFLNHIRESLHHGDYLLIGFDLRKNISTLMRAYNDSDGLTREFNLNLLHRINRDLGANFNVDKFSHYETYNVYLGAMESYLISLEAQTVAVDALEHSFTFEAFEPVHTEYSFKYQPSQIADLAHSTGFEIVTEFKDSQGFFVDSLWRVVKNT